jgi:cytochrome c5
MKITRTSCLGLWLTVFSAASMWAQGGSTPSVKVNSASKPPTSTARSAATTVAQDPGERKFQANCSRCHNAPEQLSPRIVGTVVRHMRVRASLSAEDERDILRYLAP